MKLLGNVTVDESEELKKFPEKKRPERVDFDFCECT